MHSAFNSDVSAIAVDVVSLAIALLQGLMWAAQKMCGSSTATASAALEEPKAMAAAVQAGSRTDPPSEQPPIGV
jgi:hypothetical protein